MAEKYLKVNLRMKKLYVFLLRISALSQNRKIFSWVFRTFWKRGSKITLGGGK